MGLHPRSGPSRRLDGAPSQPLASVEEQIR